MKDLFYNYIKDLQDKITQELEAIDGKTCFKEDIWERLEGGGGRTRICLLYTSPSPRDS